MSPTLLASPTPEQQVLIRAAINENPETTLRDLDEIKNWLFQQPHLPNTWDDTCLLSFLRGTQFSLDKCKKKLEKYFEFRATIPEFFTNRDITRPELQELFEIAHAAVLPNLTSDGKRISIAKPAKTDFPTPNVADLLKMVFMAGDLRIKLEKYGVAGEIYILDASIPLARHFFNVNPGTLKRALQCIQEAYPISVKEIHVINAPLFADFILKLAWPLLSENIRNCVHLHRDVESLYEFVPRELLPEEYGGSAGKLVDFKKRWIEVLEEYKWWFEEEEILKADLEKMETSTSLYDNILGWGFDLRSWWNE